MIIAGNKIYEYCSDCHKLVQINKVLFNSLHACLTREERTARDYYRYMIEEQKNYKPIQALFKEISIKE